jgi:hypothetical protein
MLRKLLSLTALSSSLFYAVPVLAQETIVESTTEGDEDAETPESEKLHWGFGVRGGPRGVPSVGLDLFYDTHPSLKDTLGTSVGLELIRRKGDVDLRLGFSFEDYTGTEGDGDQFLQKGDPIDELEFIKNTIQIISFDLNVLGATEITDWWNLTYGAGIGVGVVRGDILRTDTFAVDPNDQTVRRICTDTNQAGCFEVNFSEKANGKVPPAIPVLNMLLGMRFDFSKNVSFRIEGGLRTISVYTGAGFDFVF